MDDTISRQAAIDAVQQHREGVLGGYEYDEGVAFVYAAAHNHIIDVIKRLPSAQPEQRWIPCSERMPKKPFGCLVTVWDTNPMTGEMFENLLPEFVGWDGEQWNDIEGIQCPLEVIAWMPLPMAYKEEGHDD